jgi:hypothetical protein
MGVPLSFAKQGTRTGRAGILSVGRAGKQNSPTDVLRWAVVRRFVISKMAEGEGFEPSRILRPYTISSRADSAALAPFLRSCRSESFKLLDDILLINVAGGGEGVF